MVVHVVGDEFAIDSFNLLSCKLIFDSVIVLLLEASIEFTILFASIRVAVLFDKVSFNVAVLSYPSFKSNDKL